MGITTDNASNNIKFIEELSKDENILFDNDNHFRCFAHVINLSVQSALDPLKDNLSQVNNRN
jgi:hypothetical protein